MFYRTTAEWTAGCERLLGALSARLAEFGATPGDFALVALREAAAGAAPEGFSWRGDWHCYPCSVVKAFHLVHALAALEQGRMVEHDDLTRALRDMILWSSNTATNYVIDLLTGTTGGTLLDAPAFAAWRHRREELNRFFAALGWPEFERCNLSQEPMDDMRYGREAQYAGADGAYLNVLTPLAAARLFHERFSRQLPLSPHNHARARRTLLRDRASAEARLPHFQVETYLGGGMPPEARLWSKAGQTSWAGEARNSYFKHDLLRAELPGRPPLIVCLMTRGRALGEDRPDLFPQLGRMIFEHLLA